MDLDGLAEESASLVIPSVVPGRVAHIDADFLAYQTTAVAEGNDKSFDDMKHNAQVAIETLVSLAAASSYHLHLTPSGSDKGHRYNIAIQKEYQGNRKDKIKPQYLNLMRQHLAKEYPGTLHQFCEADDGMSSAQYSAIQAGNGNLSIIVSKDKDLNMVPGLHLVWDTGEIVDTDTWGSIWIKEKETPSGVSKKLTGYGQKFFWAQMLMGDTADNIKGLPLVHSSIADRLKSKEGKKPSGKHSLCGLVTTNQLLSQVTSNQQAFAALKLLYQMCPEEWKHWSTGEAKSWAEVFISEAQLLWMRRVKEDPMDVIRWFKELQV